MHANALYFTRKGGFGRFKWGVKDGLFKWFLQIINSFWYTKSDELQFYKGNS